MSQPPDVTAETRPGPDLSVPYLDYRVLDDGERARYLQAIDRILETGDISLGEALTRFEAAMARYCGTAFAVGTGSGTDSLHLALKALGIGHGDQVITTCLSYIGTANAIALAGAEPVFVDIEESLQIDPKAVIRAITPGTKAIMPVHLGGQIAAMADLESIAEEHGIALIEDAAQAIGARDSAGRKAGSIGVLGCLSLNPMKVLKGFGEGGVIVTDDPLLCERLRALRDNRHAMVDGRAVPGHNGRLDTIQAAALSIRLGYLEAVIVRRQAIAARYDEALSPLVSIPRSVPGARDVYYSYTIRTRHRDALARYLSGCGIGTRIQYETLLPQALPYARPGVEADFPQGVAATREVLSLPCHERLSESQQDHVIRSVQGFFAARKG